MVMRVIIQSLFLVGGLSWLFMPNIFPFLRYAFARMSGTAAEYTPGLHSIAYVTAPDENVAKTLAEALVHNKLAACVNIVPSIFSIYEWEGKIQKDNEVLMMIKTRTSRLEELTEYVRKNHPYEVCEVISVPIQQGNLPYLKWLGETVPEKS